MTSSAHVAVLAQEAIEALNIRSDGIYVDCTYGRGGHSRLILEKLGAGGRLIALDRDPEAVQAGQALRDPRFVIVRSPFSRVREVLQELDVTAVDGMLLDIGVSSPQLDDASRGFSFRGDAPLDMRMDPQHGLSAAEWLATAEESEIREVIRNHGEERFAKQIAAAIVEARTRGPVDTTRKLAALVADAVPTREPRQDPATRTFQALRIHVNRELEELSLALPRAVERLAQGGRLAVICFHSLEDRIVKRFMRDAARPPQPPKGVPVRAVDLPPPALNLVGKALFPSDVEVAANPRCRSAAVNDDRQHIRQRRGTAHRQAQSGARSAADLVQGTGVRAGETDRSGGRGRSEPRARNRSSRFSMSEYPLTPIRFHPALCSFLPWSGCPRSSTAQRCWKSPRSSPRPRKTRSVF